MKIRTLTGLMLLPMMCISCLTTRIVTVSPIETGVAHYSTTVTAPRSHTVTTTTVYTQNYDYCLQLDLQAVGAAFAQSSNVREFEILLNNSAYMISNLDLNRDGYIDYLRVVEKRVDWNTNLFVIQAVLGWNIFQDVATIIVEHPSYTVNYHVEIIGEPYIYGPNYIVRPSYYSRPRIFGHLCSNNYSVWVSPYGWDNYPSSYRRPAPVYLNHYQAYVNTYMQNHHYCHSVTYPSSAHYYNYTSASQGMHRNDYSAAHPENDFTVRNANIPVTNSAVDRANNARTRANAQDVYSAQQKNTTTAVSNSRTGSTVVTQPSNSTSSVRGGSTSTSSTTSSTATSTTNSRGNSTSSTTTATSTTRGGNTSTSSATTSTSNSSRGNSTSGTTTTATSSSRGNSTSTTIKSSVRSSGSSETTVKTVSPNGTESTVKRNSSTSTSSRSESTSGRSGSTTTSSTSSSRSEAGSSRSGSTSSRSGSTTSSTSTSRRN